MVTLPPGPGAAARPSSLLRAAAWLFCLGGFATVAAQPLTNIDIAWHLLASREWFRGAQLYVEIRDPNLPAVWLLYRGLWWLNEVTGVPAHRLLFALVALLGLAATALAARLLPAREAGDDWVRLATVVGVSAFFGFASLYQAGQRDYLISLAMLPYAAWVYRLSLPSDGPLPRRLGAAVTLLALLATLLKPYALGYVVAMELWLSWRRRSLFGWWRFDLLLPMAALALAVGLQLLAWPAYLAFIETWGHYYANQGGTAITLRVWLTIALLAGALVWLVLRPRQRGWGQALAFVALGSLVVCALQNKWWDYHAYQFELFVELAWFILLVEHWLVSRAPSVTAVRVLRLALTALAILWFAWIGLLAARQQKLLILDGAPQAELVELREALDSESPGRHVAFFGGMNCQISVYFSQARWGLAEPTLWVDGHMERALREHLPRPDWLAEAAPRRYADVLDRLERDKPVLLGFYYGTPGAPQDFLAVYRDDRAIGALIDRQYRYWRDIANYHLYRRIDG
jgi:hypothetical protein